MWIDADEAPEVGDFVLELHGWIAGPHRARRDAALADDAPRADKCILADLHAGQDRAVRSQPGPAPDGRALHALQVRGALWMGVIGEDDVRADEHIVLEGHELEEAPGVDAHARAEAVAELERRMRADGNVVAQHVVLADRCALSGLEARADRRTGIDRGERTDDRVRADDQRELALLLSARRAAKHDILADH